MKAIVHKNKDGIIKTISSMSFFIEKGHSEEDVLSEVKKKEGYSIVEVDDDVLSFFLGGKKYKRYSEYDDVCTSVSEVRSSFIDLKIEMEQIESALRRVEKLIDEEEKENI